MGSYWNYGDPGPQTSWVDIANVFLQAKNARQRESENEQREKQILRDRDWQIQDRDHAFQVQTEERDYAARQKLEQQREARDAAKAQFEQKVAAAKEAQAQKAAQEKAELTDRMWGIYEQDPRPERLENLEKLMARGIIDARDPDQAAMGAADAARLAQPKPAGPTTNMREYDLAKTDPEFRKYLKERGGGININMGKELPTGSAESLADAATAEQAIDTAFDNFVTMVPNEGQLEALKARGEAFVPNSDVSNYQRAVVDPISQVVGLYLEGGKLQASDYPRYQGFFPQPGDTKETAERKKEGLKKLVRLKTEERRKALGGSGYRVPKPSAAPAPGAAPSGLPGLDPEIMSELDRIMAEP